VEVKVTSVGMRRVEVICRLTEAVSCEAESLVDRKFVAGDDAQVDVTIGVLEFIASKIVV